MRAIVLTFLVISFFNALANKDVEVKNVRGEAFIENDVSPNRARRIALNEAKIEALRRAGVSESISAQNLLFSSEANGDFQDFFSYSSQIEIRGANGVNFFVV